MSTSSRMIRHSSYQWLSSPIIMPKMLAPAIHLSSSTADIIFAFPTKKKRFSILALSQKPQRNYPPSSENWWPFANRSFTIHKNFKSKPIKKVSSPKATPQATRSGWVVSTSKLSKIASWKPSFSVFFECYTW